MDDVKRVNAYLNKRDYSGARRLVKQLLAESPEDHWLMTKLSYAYSCEGKKRLEWKWLQRAAGLEPLCWRVRWQYAGFLTGVGYMDTALRVYEGLIKDGGRGHGRGPCRHDKALARKFVTDCYMSVAWCRDVQGDLRGAIRAVRIHVRRRESGSGSGLPLAGARRVLRRLEAQQQWQRKHAETGTKTGTKCVP